jgi:site-specific DNA-methyltransferase (adenine-specific)
MWCVPDRIYSDLDREFGFTLEAAATEKTARCSKFMTPETGLDESWEGETVFCNPPSADAVGKWTKKCFEEGKKPGTTVVLLAPAKTDTSYFHDYIYERAQDVRFLRGRFRFLDENGNTRGAAPGGSLIAVYRGPKTDGAQTVKAAVVAQLAGAD